MQGANAHKALGTIRAFSKKKLKKKKKVKPPAQPLGPRAGSRWRAQWQEQCRRVGWGASSLYL